MMIMNRRAALRLSLLAGTALVAACAGATPAVSTVASDADSAAATVEAIIAALPAGTFSATVQGYITTIEADAAKVSTAANQIIATTTAPAASLGTDLLGALDDMLPLVALIPGIGTGVAALVGIAQALIPPIAAAFGLAGASHATGFQFASASLEQARAAATLAKARGMHRKTWTH
jgi:hypothetical protein